MIPDPTDDIRAIKRKLSDACNNDIRRIVEETRRHQRESGRKSVSVVTPIQCSRSDSTNNPLQRSGEANVLDVENLSSPPAER
jgi:hypothetical protein